MFNNANNLTVFKLTGAYKFEFSRGEGELLLAKSRRGKKAERILLTQRTSRQPLKHNRVFAKRLLEEEIDSTTILFRSFVKLFLKDL